MKYKRKSRKTRKKRRIHKKQKGGTTPNLTIITPCYRPDNLDKIKESINFSLIKSWIIVYDTSNDRTYTKKYEGDPKIQEYMVSGGISGNPQRNYALTKVSDGLIYFLDDDNIIHPHFLELVPTFNEDHIYTFDQQRLNGEIRLHGNNPKVNNIDMGQIVVPYKFIGDLRFDEPLYNADGIFIEALCKKYKDKHIYIPEVASYYNYLKK